jgi:hypothetical protein
MVGKTGRHEPYEENKAITRAVKFHTQDRLSSFLNSSLKVIRESIAERQELRKN